MVASVYKSQLHTYVCLWRKTSGGCQKMEGINFLHSSSHTINFFLRILKSKSSVLWYVMSENEKKILIEELWYWFIVHRFRKWEVGLTLMMVWYLNNWLCKDDEKGGGKSVWKEWENGKVEDWMNNRDGERTKGREREREMRDAYIMNKAGRQGKWLWCWL